MKLIVGKLIFNHCKQLCSVGVGFVLIANRHG